MSLEMGEENLKGLLKKLAILFSMEKSVSGSSVNIHNQAKTSFARSL